jgi:hypothetical protein
MTTYTLRCRPATAKNYAATGERYWMVSYSLRGDRYEADERVVEIKTRDELEMAMHAQGSAFVDANPSLDGCQVSARPATRHARGCADVKPTIVTGKALAST